MPRNVFSRLSLLVLLTALWCVGPAPATLWAQTKGRTTTTQRTSAKKPPQKPAPKKPAPKKPAAKKPAAKKPQQKPAAKKPMTRQAYEKQQQELQQQIKKTERQLSDNDRSMRDQSRDIQRRKSELTRRQQLIDSQQQQVDVLTQQEDSLGMAIGSLASAYVHKQQRYAVAVRHLYHTRTVGTRRLMRHLATPSALRFASRRDRSLRYYADWRQAQGRQLLSQRLQAEHVRDEVAHSRETQEQELATSRRERATLAQQQARKEAELRNMQRRDQELRSSLTRDRRRMAEVERTIQRMIAEEVRKAEEARRRAEAQRSGKNGSSASQSRRGGTSGGGATYQVDESYKRLTGSFAQNQGRLPYPVDMAYRFVNHYDASSGNSSIVLSCAKGAKACAVYEGVVLRTFATSEEWTVIVQHGDYRSVYMNLQNVTVREGQKVSTHQALGTLKTEPDGKHCELRFWIYYQANAVNPERWLKK